MVSEYGGLPRVPSARTVSNAGSTDGVTATCARVPGVTTSEARRAARLATGAAPLCLAAATAAGWLGLTQSRAEGDDVVTPAVLVIAALALLRLGVACVTAVAELRDLSRSTAHVGAHEIGAAGPVVATPRDARKTVTRRGAPRRRDGQRRGTHPGRAAQLFLGLAAATVITTQTAGAATPTTTSVSVSAQASDAAGTTPAAAVAKATSASDDGLLGPIFDSSPDAGAAGRSSLSPSFAPVPDSSAAEDYVAGPTPITPSFTTTPELIDTSTTASPAAATASIVPAATGTTEETFPQPGWTPPPGRLSTTLAAIAIGRVRDVRITEGSTPNGTHVVLRGETLWSIAARTLPARASGEQVLEQLHALLASNPDITDADLIRPGQTITLPDASAH